MNNPKLDNLMPVKDGLIILEKKFAFKNVKITGARSRLKLKLQYLATQCEGLTHWKRPWCWEGLGAGEGNDRGWGGWMASSTQWTWVWVNSGSRWFTGKPGVLQAMVLQKVGHSWVTELNWKNKNLTFPDSEVKVLVPQLCPTLCDPVDCSPPGSSVHGIL